MDGIVIKIAIGWPWIGYRIDRIVRTPSGQRSPLSGEAMIFMATLWGAIYHMVSLHSHPQD